MKKVISMRGRTIDMSQLMTAHARKPALGNGGMNARGDRIDRSGAIITSREQVLMTEYNAAHPQAVRHVGLNDIRSEVLTPSEAVAKARKDIKEATPPHQSKRKMSD